MSDASQAKGSDTKFFQDESNHLTERSALLDLSDHNRGVYQVPGHGSNRTGSRGVSRENSFAGGKGSSGYGTTGRPRIEIPKTDEDEAELEEAEQAKDETAQQKETEEQEAPPQWGINRALELMKDPTFAANMRKEMASLQTDPQKMAEVKAKLLEFQAMGMPGAQDKEKAETLAKMFAQAPNETE